MLIVACFSLFSCYENKGNYDYSDIPELYIGGVKNVNGEDSTFIAVTNVTTVHIAPPIVALNGEYNQDDYIFQWFDEKGEVIGEEPELNYFVTLPTGTHTVGLKAKSKLNDVEVFYAYNISVSNYYSSGLLVLTEDADEYARLDMVSMVSDTLIVKNIITGDDVDVPQYKKPTFLYQGPGMYNEIYVMTEEGDMYLDPADMIFSDGNFIKIKMFSPANLWENGVAQSMHSPNGSQRVMVYDDKVFPYEPYFGKAFSYPVNFYSSETSHFKASAEIGTNFKNSAYAYAKNFVIYDMEAQRFVFHNSSYKYSYPLNDSDSDKGIFSWETGMDMVKTFHSYYNTYGDVTAVLTDNSGNYYAYRYYIHTSYKTAYKVSRTDISDAPGIGDAKCFFASSTQPYMFYTTGSKVYGYDLEYTKTFKEVLSLDGEITDVYDAPEASAYNSYKGTNLVYIATYGGTPGSGKIHKFYITDNANYMEITPDEDEDGNPIVWSGFDKIVDMQIKW